MRKFIPILLSLILVLSMTAVPAFATEPTVAIEGKAVTAELEAGEMVSVPLTITQNPGLVKARIHLAWDHTALELVSVTYNSATLPKGNSAPIAAPEGVYAVDLGSYTLEEDYTGVNEVLCTLNFKILEGAETKAYDIVLSGDSTEYFNVAEVEFPVDFVNASVTFSNNVAEIDGTYYPSLSAAVEAADDGDTITSQP